MLIRLGAVVLFTPAFVAPALVIAALGFWLGQVYMKAQLSVKREMSAAKAPVLAILGGAIAGLRTCASCLLQVIADLPHTASIRAYSAQEAFKKETAERIDRYVRTARSFYNLNR